jgi:hypothetical protein
VLKIQEILSKNLGYPEASQTAVWFPFLPRPSYEPGDRKTCQSHLVFDRGLIKALVFPETEKEEYTRLALNESIFRAPPPILISYSQDTQVAFGFKDDKYALLDGTPTWKQLENNGVGFLSEARARDEVLAVRDRIQRWLEDPLSDAAVRGLMQVHVQRGAIVQELIQNACDCFATKLSFDLEEDTLIFRHDGYPFIPENVHAITALNMSCKPPGAIGYKGIGFKAVYQVCRKPQVVSWPFRFSFEPRQEDIAAAAEGMLCPYLPIPDTTIPFPETGLTEFRLPLIKDQKESIVESLQAVTGAMLLFIASKGLSLRQMQILNRIIELPTGNSAKDGIITVLENKTPSYWFISTYEFTIGKERQKALDDFANKTSRKDFKTKTTDEQVVIAVPLLMNEGGKITPNMDHRGRFFSFLPTKDVYQNVWDINANFLVDEARDHIRTPDPETWNEALLAECGNALLAFLDVVKKTLSNADDFKVSEYFNLMPSWEEVSINPQFKTHFELMGKMFKANFCTSPRIPVYSGDNIQFVTPDKCIWMDTKLRSLFPVKTWLRFFTSGKKLALFDLDKDIWQTFLFCDENGTYLYDGVDLVTALSDEKWIELLSVQPGSADIVPLIGRICAFLKLNGITSEKLGTAWIIPRSTDRMLYRPNDNPDGKSFFRIPEEGLAGLPQRILDSIVVAHNGVLRFLQHDTSYFKGEFSKDITDEMAAAARDLWVGLFTTLDFDNVILVWLAEDFNEEHDSDQGILALRDEWICFLMLNTEKITGSTKEMLGLRLLARLNGLERWKSAEEIWLYKYCPQGLNVEGFIVNTPGVVVLSDHYASIFANIKSANNAIIGAFFVLLGVNNVIKAKDTTIYYYPGTQMEAYCRDLGIPVENRPQGDINSLRVHQYSLPLDISRSLENAISDNLPQRRQKRLNAFASLLQESWPEHLKTKCHKEGKIHVKGAREDTPQTGDMSDLGITIYNTQWIPLANDNKILKRPRETCLLTEESIKYVDLNVGSNYTDILFENAELIDFLGFQSRPIELSSIDAIRGLSRNWENLDDPRSDFEILYSKLASELNTVVSLQEAQTVFRDEKLIFIPAKMPVFRSSEEVLANADVSFNDFLEDLSNYYSPSVCILFNKLGVANKVQDVHYLRYLVFYIWKDKPALTEVRREMILKVYRRLIEWAENQPADQGIWSTPEGRAFTQAPMFYGNCAGEDGWFKVDDKTVVYRDDPQIEAILSNKSQYVLESHVPRLDRPLDRLMAFLTLSNIKPASTLATRKVITADRNELSAASANLRQNAAVLLNTFEQPLPKILTKEQNDDLRNSRFLAHIKEWQSIILMAEVVRCTSICITFPEIMDANDTSATCDAAIDLNDNRIQILISSDQCMDVSSAISREIKQMLRTDTLAKDIQTKIENVVEDISGWIEKNPDVFQNRLKDVLKRHFPKMISNANIVEIPGIQVGLENPASGLTGIQTGLPGGTPKLEDIGGSQKPGGIPGAESAPFIMPDFQSQQVTMSIHPSEDFTIIPDQKNDHSIRKDRTTKSVKRLTDAERNEVGRRAELLVLQSEKTRLVDEGYPQLVGKVVDRNMDGYDPNGPYDIDSIERDADGQWRPVKIEVKGHLDPEIWGFELSRSELETALTDFGTSYYVYLVLNLRDINAQIHKLEFRKLWQEKRLNYRSQKIEVALRPV